MKNAVGWRIVAIVALASACLQAAPAQLPSPAPPPDAPAPPPANHAAAPVKPGDLPAEAIPPSVSDSTSRNRAGAAAKQSEALSPAKSSYESFAAAGRGDKFRLKTNVDLVLIEATVRDQHGGIVNNLTRESFGVYENGVEQQVTYFARDQLPLAVALVLDCSGSMGPVLRQLHHVAFDALSALKPDDQVALFDFAARAELLVSLTKNRQRIADAIATIRPGGGTVIPDALYEAALYLSRVAPGRRHAVILVSDNENTEKGYCDEKKVIHQALESEAVIYSIRVAEGSHPHSMYVIPPILEEVSFREVSVPKMTHETGGEVIDARNLNSIRSAMDTAISRLKQRYNLGYYSTNHSHDGAFREIAIHIKEASNDVNYTVYARSGYYAPGEEGSGQ
jgi:Ca-activated chloride channel family protein